MTSKVPNKIPSLIGEKFESYGDALYKYLEFKGLQKVWLAEKITPEGQNVENTQGNFSKWKKEGTKPRKETRKKIGEILGVNILKDPDGQWTINDNPRTRNPQTQLNGENAEELVEEFPHLSELNLNELNDFERDLAAQLIRFARSLKGSGIPAAVKIEMYNSLIADIDDELEGQND